MTDILDGTKETKYGILSDQLPESWPYQNQVLERLDSIQERRRAAEKYVMSFSSIEQKKNSADVIVISLDLDGVVFRQYDHNSSPVFEKDQFVRMKRHIKRLKKIAKENGKRVMITLNTFRELSFVNPLYEELGISDDPKFASLEGGHIVFSQVNGKEGEVQNMLEVIEGSFGSEGKTLMQIRSDLEEGIKSKLKKGFFDTEEKGIALIPDGIMGMLTVRNVGVEVVSNNPDQIGKKYMVNDITTPIAKFVREIGGFDDNMQDWPLEIVYYSGDGGLVIRFKGCDKLKGQKKVFSQLRKTGTVNTTENILGIHIGDGTDDNIPIDGSDENVVVAVANGPKHLKDKSIANTNRAYQAGLRAAFYTIGEQMKNNESAQEVRDWGLRGGVGDHVEGYLGRENPREGDVDLLRALDKLDISELNHFKDIFEKVKKNGGRVFLVGNGGSYDNARLIANMLREAEIDANTPGDPKLYRNVTKENGYSQIFVEALKAENFGKNDVVVGISGSGNSPNVVEALKYALQKNGTALALGGRDGGEMKEIVGEKNIIIAPTENMECLEDIHPDLSFAIVESIKNGSLISDELEEVKKVVDSLRTGETLSTVTTMVEAIERTIFTRSRVHILGDPDAPSVTHAEADWGKGLIGPYPIHGPNVRTFINSNADMAVANDNGPIFSLLARLNKVDYCPDDVIVVFAHEIMKDQLKIVYEKLKSKVQIFVIGGEKKDLPEGVFHIPVEEKYIDIVATHLIHATSAGTREHIGDPEGLGWDVVPLIVRDLPENIQTFIETKMGDQKQLDDIDTIELESILKQANLLPEGKVIAWNYGSPLLADDPARFGLERSFF